MSYVFNKFIFRCVVVALIILFIISLFLVGFNDKVYAKCSLDVVRCENPFYGNCEALDNMRGSDPSLEFARYLCTDEFLLGGVVVGEPPSWFMRNKNFFALSIILLGFILNHFLCNKNIGGFFK